MAADLVRRHVAVIAPVGTFRACDWRRWGISKNVGSVARLIKLDDRCLRVKILSVIGTTSDD
jgi:hypothetical protein